VKLNRGPAILVFRSAALGDFIMAVPALAEIRNVFPNYQVILLTTTSGSESLRAKAASYAGTNSTPWTSFVEPHLVDKTLSLRDVSSMRGVLIARSELSAYKFDFCIMLNDPGAGLEGRFKKLLMLKVIAGLFVPVLGWRRRRLSNSNRITAHQQVVSRHHVHGPLQFLSEMTPPRKYEDKDLVFDLRPGHDAIAWASTWLRENHLHDRKRLVALAPGSIQPHKRWPLESFMSLLVSLLARYDDAHFIVIGTPSDKELGDVLTAVDPQRVYNLAGITSITQSAALLQQCHLLVGNDGGAMHLGDAMGCKVVSIVPGIEFPDSIEPWHNKALAVRHPIACSPCYNFVSCPQRHNRCMTELPVERVLANCSLVLDQQ